MQTYQGSNYVQYHFCLCLGVSYLSCRRFNNEGAQSQAHGGKFSLGSESRDTTNVSIDIVLRLIILWTIPNLISCSLTSILPYIRKLST